MSKWHHEPHLHEGEPTGAIQIGEEWSYCRRVLMINPTERRYYDHAYVMWFGAYGWTRLHVFASDLEDALETCAAWLADHAPGLITKSGDEQWNELMAEACAERGLAWPIPEDADLEPYHEAEDGAMSDQTRTESGWINEDCGMALKDPTAKQLYDYIKGN